MKEKPSINVLVFTDGWWWWCNKWKRHPPRTHKKKWRKVDVNYVQMTQTRAECEAKMKQQEEEEREAFRKENSDVLYPDDGM